MDYTYLLESEADRYIKLDDIFRSETYGVFNILCYHINVEAKYPFLQFLMDKVPYCNNIIKERFTIPSVMYYNLDTPIETLALEKVSDCLQQLGMDNIELDEHMYKGVLYDTLNNPYVMVNITGLDIRGYNLSRNTFSWFLLPSEIINNRQVCNIEVDEEVVEWKCPEILKPEEVAA
jgi:hypothetical protein